MTCTISKIIDNKPVPFIRTNMVGVSVRSFMQRRRRGEAVRLEIRQ